MTSWKGIAEGVRAWWMAVGAIVLSATVGACTIGDPHGSAGDSRSGWQITVYYTAVESFHDDELVDVEGCTHLRCTRGDAYLGSFPGDFVEAVRAEGTGRITSGLAAGRYLNWAMSEGYWLDEAPRDAYGRTLEPFRSAAADELPKGTEVQIVECGRGDDGVSVPPPVCERLRSGDWEIRDEFTPGLGGARHIDLYIGEEAGPNFTRSKMFTSFEDATIRVTPPTG